MKDLKRIFGENVPLNSNIKKPIAENVLITPEMAEMLYKTSKGNRQINQKKVDDYARQMIEGKWTLNGETIIFSEEGYLYDGHHRMLAVMKAKTPIWFTVIRGVDKNTFATIDSGQSRSSGQVFTIAGIPNSNVVSSVVSSVEILRKCGQLRNNYNLQRMSKQEMIDTYYADEQGYQEAVTVGSLAYKNRLLKKTFVAAVYYYLVNDCGWEKSYVEQFLLAATGVKTTNISQAEALRVAITQKRMAKGQQLENKYAFLMVAKAWNYYVKKQPIKILRIDEVTDSTLKLAKNKSLNMF